MKKLNVRLEKAFREAMRVREVPFEEQTDWVKWLRFYLDFCLRYHCSPREQESLQPWLEKLAARRQTPRQQDQAARAVRLYWDTVVEMEAGLEIHPSVAAWEGVMLRLKEEIMVRQYSPVTLRTYGNWVRQFGRFLAGKMPEEVDDEDAVKFLTYLAEKRGVVAATQNQAFSALLFLYRHVLKAPYELGDRVVRAKRRKHLPVVLGRAELEGLFAKMDYPYQLLARLMYGCGLRLKEGLRLRVQDFNFEDGILTVRRGKGGKDRTVPLPEVLREELEEHLARVRHLYECDLAERYDGATMPLGSEANWDRKAREWPWQYFFPSRELVVVAEGGGAAAERDAGSAEAGLMRDAGVGMRDGQRRRSCMDGQAFGKALREASRAARIPKRVTAHVLRHSFASHLVLAGYDITTVRDLLGHANVQTTMIYLQTVPERTRKTRRSPLDLGEEAFSGGGQVAGFGPWGRLEFGHSSHHTPCDDRLDAPACPRHVHFPGFVLHSETLPRGEMQSRCLGARHVRDSTR